MAENDAQGYGSLARQPQCVSDSDNLVARSEARGVAEGQGEKTAATDTDHCQVTYRIRPQDCSSIVLGIVHSYVHLRTAFHDVMVGDDVAGPALGFKYGPEPVPEPVSILTTAGRTSLTISLNSPAGDMVGVGVGVGRGVAVGTGVAVGRGVAVGTGVAVGRGVAVGTGVAVGRGVAVGTGVAVGRGVAVGIGVGVGVAVGRGVTVGIGVGVGVAVGRGVTVGIGVGVGVAVG